MNDTELQKKESSSASADSPAMSATILSDPLMVVSTAAAGESQAAGTKLVAAQINEVEFAKCESCGLTEECTPGYIQRVRERYQGKWICGLCAEAVKDEIIRAERLISTEEAMARHMSFRKKFKSSSPPSDPTVHLISAMRQILRRSLDSPRSTPTSPTNNTQKGSVLSRSESCFPSLSG